jgi:2,4-dienoyl-CoA reductase-like NADH-dependent reductase (Old Yellow Enzyme family)
VPIEVFLKELEVYRRKNPLYRFIMRRFGKSIVKPPPLTQAYNREAARAIRGRVDVPVFLVGGITDPVAMEEIVRSGDADYISLCRALIADPTFPKKIREGSSEPSRCIHCNLCVGYMATEPLRCYNGKPIR